jgi:signal transduction histidine kinase
VALRSYLAQPSAEGFDHPEDLLDQGHATHSREVPHGFRGEPRPFQDESEERRRIARDLHDGLAQELAYIAIESKRLAALHEQREELTSIAGAAERALQETRRVMESLITLREEPLDRLIADEAEAVAARWGVDAVLAVDPVVRPSPVVQQALLRIVREAVTNAARHGQARRVWIYVEADEGITLRVVDDGVGFEPADVSGAGFGLTSMRERVEVLGGELHLESLPTAGTTVEVSLP